MKVLRKLAALVLAGALCVSSLAGCGINKEATVATLGEQEVSLGLANFMVKYYKASMDDSYTAISAMLGGADAWDGSLSMYGYMGKDDLVNYVMNILHLMYTLDAHTADYKVTVTEEEQKEIEEAAAAFIESNSKDAINELGATEEIVAEYLRLTVIATKMEYEIVKGADHVVSDEDANMRGYSYVAVPFDGETKDGKFVEYTDEEVNKIKENVNKMIDELTAEGSTAKLEDVAKKYKYDLKTGAYSTKTDSTAIDKELLKAMKALKEGETSKLIEGDDDVFYIVRIDADTDEKATKEKRESIIEERETKFYQDKITEWQTDDGWTVNTKVLEDIEFYHKFTLQDGSTQATSESEKSTETESETGTETGTETESETGTEK